MLVSDLPIWTECPFEVEGVDVRLGRNELGHELFLAHHLRHRRRLARLRLALHLNRLPL